jgi:hypothetical protein
MYAESDAATEVRFGDYRIDAVRGDQLIEIQFASLASIRDKIRCLVKTSKVRVVKPIVAKRTIVRQNTADGPVISRRLSPKRGSTLDLFDELVYWTRVFPHPNLVLEIPLVSVEEWRLPPSLANRRRRRYKPKHHVKDVVLCEVLGKKSVRGCGDLMKLIAADQLPKPFDTAELAAHLDCPRWSAQRIAYVLRNMGAIDDAGKRGNARTYFSRRRARPRPAA